MPTRSENSEAWGGYDWSRRGDEWSDAWGGTDALWWCTLFPRICRFVPAPTLLEIAPGFGRCTAYLKELADSLLLVDLSERCIDACRERFRDEDHIRYLVKDGLSLEAVPDGSVDFVFSYDSLVHAEADVMDGYLRQLGDKLAPEGVGFLHHSNLGVYRDETTGALSVENPHWRAESMTAERMVSACEAAGLRCISQEIVNWGGPLLSDCFSSFCRPASRWAGPLQRVENPHFMAEAERVRVLATLYGLGSPRDPVSGESDPARDEAAAPLSPGRGRLRNLLRLLSPRGPVR